MDKVSKKNLKARKTSRTAFTRHYNLIERYLAENNVPDAKVSFGILEEEWNKLQELDSAILDEMFDQEDILDAELDKEKESTDDYKIKYGQIRLKMQEIEAKRRKGMNELDLVHLEDNQSNLSVSNDQCKSLKLPPINIETFDGELKSWLPFWGQFEHIHNDETISTFHKFRILHQSMKPGSRAKQVVDSFPVSKDMKNYDAAVGALKERFGREDLLIEVYIRELLEMIIHNSRTSQFSLVEMYDKLECHLRFLEILGVTSGKSAAILCPLLESCMSEDFLRVWQRSESVGTIKDAEERLVKFREFIKSEVQNEQRISLAMSKFGISNKSDGKVGQRRDTKHKANASPPTALGLFTGNGNEKKANCIFCDQSHSSTDCFKARDMSLDDKLKKVRDFKCCYLCLKKSHSSKQCRVKTSCPICDRKHALILCPNYCRSKTQAVQDNAKAVSGNQGDTAVNVATSRCDDSVILPTLHVKLMNEEGQSCIARAIIDTAAQRSYILNSTAERLNLKSSGEESLYHSLFGGKRTDKSIHKKFQVTVSSISSDYKCKVQFLGQDVICGKLSNVPKGPWINEMIAAGINVSDLSKDEGSIELLLGADVAGLFFVGNVKRLSSGTLVCFETCFGWTVSGKLPSETPFTPEKKSTAAYLTTTMFCNALNVSDLWRLDLIGIDDPTQHKQMSEVEADVKRHFLETVKVNEEGRYEVNLPWKENHVPLPTNFELAAKRLESTVKRLESDGHLAEYQNVFDEWKSEGIIEEIPQSKEGHFIPHRHVVKLNSTTKIRPVFDASAHQKNAPSLNHILEKGCNVIEQIPSLLHCFRMHEIGVVADIRRAFLQISIDPSDRKFLRFLWYDSDKKLIVYQHNRVMFGLTSSPYLLGAVIDYHLDKTKETVLQGKQEFPLNVIDTLKTCFYVDNVVHSVNSKDELQTFVENATKIMKHGMFDLRGWEHTDSHSNPQVLTSVLGIYWNRCNDTLEINTKDFDSVPEKVTKRIIMSAAHKIFDPLGFVSPVTVYPKLFMKELWLLKAEWDEDVPEDIKSKFMKWFDELKYLKDVKVPRWLFTSNFNHVSIHTFTDASELAYAAVVFVRVEHDYGVKVQLVQSKTRISPEKRVTVPRLELLAANIGARLFSTVKRHFDVEEEDTYFWSDSTTAIAWIKRQENWGIFVSNRVTEIRNLTDPNQWHHIPGVMNPADLPSRGCLGKTLVETAWWEGPEWLYLPSNTWPTSNPQEFNEEEILVEKRKTVSTLVTNAEDVTGEDWCYRYFSNYQKSIRMIAWMHRFLNNCRSSKCHDIEKKTGALTVEEYAEAELKVLKLVQIKSFAGINDKKIAHLKPFEDESGLIRLQTKISNKQDSFDFRFPILLPKDHPLVMRLIHSIHVRECHVGVQGLLAIVREHYWVIGGRRVMKSIISKCVICRKQESKKIEVPSPSLPVDRVRTASAFEVVGVDLAGPMYLKDKVKAWICLFTCGVVRAVHLELLPSLSTEDFILGLRRFAARRGRPARIYCDQGTNFRGAENLFKRIDFKKVLEYSEVYKITWKFNPPAAPWWGGWWERLVGLTKRLLRRVLGKSTLNYVEMETVLCDCESVLNSRPLTFISEDSTDAYPITPSLFIQDTKEAGLPELDVIESKSFNKKWLHRQRLKQHFRKRFRNEYLGLLTSRATSCKETQVKVGDIVLIGSDNTKRLDWPLAKIEELIPGRDGRTRVVRLKTNNGELIRPIQRIYPLLEGQSERDELCK